MQVHEQLANSKPVPPYFLTTKITQSSLIKLSTPITHVEVMNVKTVSENYFTSSL